VVPQRDKAVTVCVILPQDLTITKDIGRGEFGTVQQGLWKRQEDDMEIPVAVKSLDGNQRGVHQDAFIKEANVMHQINHKNIIRLYGIVLSTPFKLVTELAPIGSLIDLLRSVPRKVSVYQLCDFSCQIACGMAYLERKNYVHRDLAARNVLLKSLTEVKISDFGLTRAVDQTDQTYVMATNSLLPIAWTAPEALDTKQFTSACDVWSFGITLWEMFSYGAEPYDDMSHIQVMRFVQPPTNGRLEKPKECPSKVWQIVYNCWNPNLVERPTFPDIEQHLKMAMPIRMKATQDYHGRTVGPDRLSIKKNEVVTVIEDRLPHYFGQNQALEVGIFPAQCVVHLMNEDEETKVPPSTTHPALHHNMSRLSVTSTESPTDDSEYLSMHAVQESCLLITPDEEYTPMKSQYQRTRSAGGGDSKDEGAMRLALGENITLPPFQPMPPRQVQTSPEPLPSDRQHQAVNQQCMSMNYPAGRDHHCESLTQTEFAPDVDMYTENGGYDQRRYNNPRQARQPDHYQTQVKQQGCGREEPMLGNGSSEMARLWEMLPDVEEADIRNALTLCNWDVQKAFERIRISQMLDLGLEGSTAEKCRRALEHCRWKIDRAAAWLMDNSS
jgi:serine/threonine protein kinase